MENIIKNILNSVKEFLTELDRQIKIFVGTTLGIIALFLPLQNSYPFFANFLLIIGITYGVSNLFNEIFSSREQRPEGFRPFRNFLTKSIFPLLSITIFIYLLLGNFGSTDFTFPSTKKSGIFVPEPSCFSVTHSFKLNKALNTNSNVYVYYYSDLKPLYAKIIKPTSFKEKLTDSIDFKNSSKSINWIREDSLWQSTISPVYQGEDRMFPDNLQELELNLVFMDEPKIVKYKLEGNGIDTQIMEVPFEDVEFGSGINCN